MRFRFLGVKFFCILASVWVLSPLLPASARVLREPQRIADAGYALPPLGHARFCVQYPQECRVRSASIRKAKVRMTPQREQQLAQVNTRVNAAILPQHDAAGLVNDIWTVSPRRGDCDDYAVTKRAQLLRSGWPSRSLLLTAARLPDGQSHLVVVVRSSDGDFVLDNLSGRVRPVAEAPYRWEMIQDEANPRFWRKVKPGTSLVAIARPAPIREAQKPREVASVSDLRLTMASDTKLAFAEWDLRLATVIR